MFDPANWYWRADDGRIFDSARQATVADTDMHYQAWVGGGRCATRWPSDRDGAQTAAALQDVLAPYGLFVDLGAYAAAARYRRETGGIIVAGSPIATDRESQALVNGAFNLVQQEPATVMKFKTGAGFVDLDAAAIQIIAMEVGQHVQRCFAKEADVAAAIASGAITTTAAIEAAFAAL